MDALERLRGISFTPLGGVEERVRAIAQVLAGEPAERVVDALLRARRGASAEERKAIAELCFGIGLWRRRAAHHAGVAGRPEEAAEVIFGFLRDLARVPEPEALRLAPLERPAPLVPAPEAPAVALSLPDWLWRDAALELGEEALQLGQALNLPGPVFLRVNTLKAARAQIEAELGAAGILTEPGRWAPQALRILTERPNIYGLDGHRRSAFEVQDEGSQLIGAAVGAEPGHKVLDFCAGAGGKTLLLGAALDNRGELHAYDVAGEKLERLRQRAQRAGVTTLRIHHQLPADAQVMDRVLVDGPCSETGALRRGPDLRFRIDPVEVERLPALQLELLSRAARHVRQGGWLVYATCSFRRAENEEVVARFLEAHRAFAVLPAPVPDQVRRGPFLRTWPHLHGTDAFFAAVLQRGPR